MFEYIKSNHEMYLTRKLINRLKNGMACYLFIYFLFQFKLTLY